MAVIQDKALDDFIKSIDDPSQRRQLKEIATQKLLYKVYCNSKKCKGKLICHIYLRNGREVPEEQVDYEIRHRRRSDNEHGFKCGKCGNDSIMCDEEKGVLRTSTTPNHPSLTPTTIDLKKIATNLSRREFSYDEKDGKKEVDGFVIERIS